VNYGCAWRSRCGEEKADLEKQITETQHHSGYHTVRSLWSWNRPFVSVLLTSRKSSGQRSGQGAAVSRVVREQRAAEWSGRRGQQSGQGEAGSRVVREQRAAEWSGRSWQQSGQGTSRVRALQARSSGSIAILRSLSFLTHWASVKWK
jgi:hypothetical protein